MSFYLTVTINPDGLHCGYCAQWDACRDGADADTWPQYDWEERRHLRTQRCLLDAQEGDDRAD